MAVFIALAQGWWNFIFDLKSFWDVQVQECLISEIARIQKFLQALIQMYI